MTTGTTATTPATDGWTGETLHQLRTLARLSQDELAKLAGVTRTSLRRAERGEWVPSAGWAQNVAAAIGDHAGVSETMTTQPTVESFTSAAADLVFTTSADLDREHTGSTAGGAILIRLDVDGEGFDEILSSETPAGHRERIIAARDALGRALISLDALTRGD